MSSFSFKEINQEHSFTLLIRLRSIKEGKTGRKINRLIRSLLKIPSFGKSFEVFVGREYFYFALLSWLLLNALMVVHKWRHASFDHYWLPLPLSRFLLIRLKYCRVVTNPLPPSTLTPLTYSYLNQKFN